MFNREGVFIRDGVIIREGVHIREGMFIIPPPQNGVLRGYTVFRMSVIPSFRNSVNI